MSIVAESTRLLESDSAIFAFLPAVSNTYLVVSGQHGTTAIVWAGGSLLVSTFLYNFLRHVKIHDSDNDLYKRNAVIFVLLLVFWAVAFSRGIWKLYQLFEIESPWPEIIVGVSALFVFLVFSDLLLGWIVDDYRIDD